MMKLYSQPWLLIVLTALITLSCQKNETQLDELLTNKIKQISETGELDYYIFPDSDDYANLPLQDPNNPITAAKVELGNFLFFETGLAQIPLNENCYETYSCSSCHIPSAGFLPGRIQGIGDGARGIGENGEFRILAGGYTEHDVDAQGTRPMNPFNAGYSTVTLWSGTFGAVGPNVNTEEHWTGLAEVNHTRYMGLEAQNIEAFDLHRLEINDKVLDEYGYRALYDEAFPDFPESSRYSPTTSSFAISAFIRSFLANKAPFQEWLKGNTASLTDNQKEGALLFFGKAGCSSCHNNPALGAMKFYALGTADMYQHGGMNTSEDDVRNLGRGMFTGEESDMRKFKVPQLYNLKDYAFYFHGSSKSSLEEVLDFKLEAKSENPNVTNEQVDLYPRDLSTQEKQQLLDFLKNALYDSDYQRYVPESIPSGNCFPNNDALSQMNLDCS